jgi:hypothetical protein
LAELKTSTIPKVVNLFENAFELSFTDNLKVSTSSHDLFQGIMEIANTIDEKLFADYTRRKAKIIKEIVKKGILEGIDWSALKQPFGRGPFSIKSVNFRCPTIRPPSPSLSCFNPRPSHIHLPRTPSPRNDRPSGILLSRSPLFIP